MFQHMMRLVVFFHFIISSYPFFTSLSLSPCVTVISVLISSPLLCFFLSLPLFLICYDYEEAAVHHRQFHNSVCLWWHRTDGERDKRKMELKQVCSLLTNFDLHVCFLPRVLCLLVFYFSLILSSTYPPFPTYRVTGLWNVKNCRIHGNSLSCQTSQSQLQATGTEKEIGLCSSLCTSD